MITWAEIVILVLKIVYWSLGKIDQDKWMQAGADAEIAKISASILRKTAAGKAIMVWNGDWVATLGQEGKGLAAVREAITWEVAFAPQACRAEPVHGLILISMGQTQGSTRLALGLQAWRWADLLKPGPEG